MASVTPINFKSANLLTKTQVTQVQQPKQQTAPQPVDVKTAKTLAMVSSAVALASLGVTGVVALKRGKFDAQGFGVKLKNEIAQEIKNVSDALTTKIDESLDVAIKGLDPKFEKASQETKDLGKYQDGIIEDMKDHLQKLQQEAGATKIADLEHSLGVHDGFKLLQNLDGDGKRLPVPQKVLDKISGTAHRYIYGYELPPTQKLTKNSNVWSITAETIPEKEGGLGEVPIQIAKNFQNELNVKSTIVRPMIEIKGKSKLVEEIVDNVPTYKYFYNLDKTSPDVFDLKKLVEFETSVFRNGKCEKQNVEVFSAFDKHANSQRLMFRNSTYNSTKGLYTPTQDVSEAERYTFFSKSVYDFMKFKFDENAHTSIKVFDRVALNAIDKPSAMILNDWHAGPLAALMRYKAPIEGAMSELNPKAANEISSMNLVNIVHNATYQGESYLRGSEILNTLFDKYTLDIVEHANSGIMLKDLGKTLYIGDNNVNLANMGLTLSNKVKPVSSTYATELCNENDKSRSLQHIFSERLRVGTMVGQSNGWDKVANEISIKNIDGYNNNVNDDKFKILMSAINKLQLSTTENTQVKTIFQGLNHKTFEDKVRQLREIGNDNINSQLNKLEKESILTLRKFIPNISTDSIEDILKAKAHNKAEFFNYLKSMVDYNKANPQDNLFNVTQMDLTDLSHIDPAKLNETFFVNMGTRFVSQKGIDVAVESIKKQLLGWEKNFPNKPKPLYIIGGADGEGGEIRKVALKLKESLGADSKQVVYMDGYAPNNIFQGGSDLTLMPSKFEPDGSRAESMNKLTPVGATRTGGHVDGIKDKINGYLTKHTLPEIGESCQKGQKDFLDELSNDYVENVMNEGARDFYDATKRVKMFEELQKYDYSWTIKDASGKILRNAPMVKHLEDLGFDLNDFEEIAKIKP